MLPIPHIELAETPAGFCAGAGLVLSELEATRLPTEGTNWVQVLAEKHHRTMRLVEIFAAWPANISIELHLVSRPSLDPQQAGKVDIGLKLNALEQDRDRALEACLFRFVALRSLLDAYWTEAYFRPLQTPGEMRSTFRPFRPGSATLVCRRSAEIVLSEPYHWSSRPFGFQAPRPNSPGGNRSTAAHVFPWLGAENDWAFLLRSLLNFPAPHWIIVRLSRASGGGSLEQLRENVRTCEEFLAAGRPNQLTLSVQADALRRLCAERLQKLTAQAVRLAVVICAAGETDDSLACVLGQSVSGSTSQVESMPSFIGGFALASIDPHRVADPFFFPDQEPYGVDEAACAFRLPVVQSRDDDFGLPVRRSRTGRTILPPAAEPATVIAANLHRGVAFPLRVPLEHRFKHTFLFGMTGTGKSTFLLNLLLQDLHQGHGLCLIDPHGQLADELLARFPKSRERDLFAIDLADCRRIVPLNFLRWSTEEERDLIVDDLYRTLDRVYDFHETGGPIFEHNFRGMLKLLMGDCPDAEPVFTLLELPLTYLNEDFRRYLANRSRDPQLKDFVEELDRTRGEASANNLSPYVTSKFNRFMQDQRLRCVVGHGEMRLDFCRVLDDSQVLIVKLGVGRFGSRTAEILLGLLLSRFRSAVMARAERPCEDRRPFFLYVDEIGSLAQDENFSQLLSEARKYRVGLVAASQYASQLKAKRSQVDTLAAVLGNVGTVVAFRIGVQDAEALAPIFAPRFQAQDLVELPNFHGYVRLHLDSAAVPPASFAVEKPAPAGSAERAHRLCRAAQDRWAVAAEECSRRIEERRRFMENL